MVARALALMLFAATAGAQTVFVTTNNYNTLNPEVDALAGSSGSFRITHTITDGSNPLSFEYLQSPINLIVVDLSDGFTNSINSAIETNSPGVVRWEIPNLTSGSYSLRSDITIGGDTFSVFWRYLTVSRFDLGATNVLLNQFITNFSYNATSRTMTLQGSGGGGALSVSVTNVTTNYTAVVGNLVLADTYANPITITMPAATNNTGKQISCRIMSSSNLLTIESAAGDTINGESSIGLSIAGNAVDMISDGYTNWWVK